MIIRKVAPKMDPIPPMDGNHDDDEEEKRNTEKQLCIWCCSGDVIAMRLPLSLEKH